MSSLRSLNCLELLGAAAAGAGAGTGAFVQISGAQQKPAAKSRYICATRKVLGSRISPLFRSRGCQGGEIHECELIGRDYISAPLWRLCLERTAAGSDRGGDCIEPGYPVSSCRVEPDLRFHGARIGSNFRAACFRPVDCVSAVDPCRSHVVSTQQVRD